eukprot:5090977-Alexandrium_andersonii.AAC.1
MLVDQGTVKDEAEHSEHESELDPNAKHYRAGGGDGANVRGLSHVHNNGYHLESLQGTHDQPGMQMNEADE